MKFKPCFACVLFIAAQAVHAAGPKAEVVHWWTSGGESAAVREFAKAYTAAGGVWVDTAIAGGEAARSVVINRIIGGNAPTAAQFNTSTQFHDLIEQGMLANVDDLAAKENWEKNLPEPLLNLVRFKNHYYAVPVDIHNLGWIWYSAAAFKKAGITSEPANADQLFAALDKLKAAGIVPLAHGGQSWQDNIVFLMMLANVGGQDLYLKVVRDRDQRAINSEEFRKVLVAYKRLQTYVDPGSPGRNWNDATAMLISGKAGIQIMGDWVKGEFTAAHQVAGKDYGCVAGLGPKAPYLIQGDAIVFPKSTNPETIKAQKLLGTVLVAPATQLEFNKLKGAIPVRSDLDASSMDACAQKGMAIMKDKSRQVGFGEVYLTPDQMGAMFDINTAYWNGRMTLDKAQKSLAAALKD